MQTLTHGQLAQQNIVLPEGDFYKFTNLNSLLKSLPVSEGASSKTVESDFPTLVVEDGVLKNTELHLAGVRIQVLSTPSVFLGRAHPLTHLQKSIAQSFEIIIEKNIQLEKPIRIQHRYSQQDVSAPQIFVRLWENSKATVIEESFGSGVLTLHEMSVQLASGSKLELIQITDLDQASFFHGATAAIVEQDAHFSSFFFHLGGKLNRRNLDLKLRAPGSHGSSFNLALTNGVEHSDINTIIEHESADSTSEQLAKGILDDESKGIFTGKIHIHPKAQRVSSGQLNKNLLLSKKAQSHSQPQLEIFADDVKCSHGSTTGQLSPEEMFYFEARGIPAEKARTLLAHGFGLEVVLKIQNKMTRERVSSLILDKLQTKFHIGEKK